MISGYRVSYKVSSQVGAIYNPEFNVVAARVGGDLWDYTSDQISYPVSSQVRDLIEVIQAHGLGSKTREEWK